MSIMVVVVVAMRDGKVQLHGLERPGSARHQRDLKRRFSRSSGRVSPRRTGPLGLAAACALVFAGVFAAGLALPAMPAMPGWPIVGAQTGDWLALACLHPCPGQADAARSADQEVGEEDGAAGLPGAVF